MWVVRYGGAVHEPIDRWGLRPLDYLLFHPRLHGPNAQQAAMPAVSGGEGGGVGDAAAAAAAAAIEEPPASMAAWHARDATAGRAAKFAQLFGDDSATVGNKAWLQSFFPLHAAVVVEATVMAAWLRRRGAVMWWHVCVRLGGWA